MRGELMAILTPAELRVAETKVLCQSRAATARKLGVSSSTVHRLLYRARRKIAAAMTPQERSSWIERSVPVRRIQLGSLSDVRV